MPISFFRHSEEIKNRRYGHLARDTGADCEPKENKKTNKRRSRQWSWQKKGLKILVFLFASFFALCFIAGTIMVVWVTRDLPDPNKLMNRQVSQSTKIYDRTGQHLLYEVYQDQKRTLVELDQIADYAKKAIVAVEDKDFYTHKGIRIQSIIRAGVNNLLGRQSGSGGASTLTQQFIKKAVVGDEHTIYRKIKEAILAIRLEKKYSKDQILKMYLNEIPYGSTNYGIESASQSYFHKSAKDLTLEESATLAAIPKAPSAYLNDINALRERRDMILSMMYDQGYITADAKQQAQNTALRFYSNAGPLIAPHFILYVKQLLADSFGEKNVDEGGLKVITTLDYNKQKIAEKAVEEIGKINAEKYGANNASLVALDPKTGEVLSMVGSRDFDNDKIDGKYNVAVLGKRQPGSSLKPFIYLAAFAKGFTPETVIYDVKTDFGKNSAKSYIPKNYSGLEYGLVTLRKALQGSLNITAVKTLYLVGAEEMIKLASEKFGYTTFTGDYGLSLVLGGAEVTLLEHTAAYAALANEGKYNKPITILNVKDNKGNEIYKAPKSTNKEAMDKNTVAILDSVLSDDSARAYMFGSNSQLTLPNRPVATKTGTTDDSKDAWTMGYTPSLAVGVWVGNTKPSPMKGGGSMLATPIWNKFMREALDKTPVENFPKPEKKTVLNPWLNGSSGGIEIEINKKTNKIAVTSTPATLIVKKKYLPPHNILYYVNKNNPNGPAPTNPTSDPQYDAWEAGLQDWILRQQKAGNNITLEEPPTEYDNGQSSDISPTIEFITPTSSDLVLDSMLKIKIKASAPNGVSKVTYQIDGVDIGSTTQYPFDFTSDISYLVKGKHTLIAVAEDDQNNYGQTKIDFFFKSLQQSAVFIWADESPLILKKEDFPRLVEIIPTAWDKMEKIDIYLKSSNGEKYIYNFNHKEDALKNNRLQFTWKTFPGNGSFVLRAVMKDEEGVVMEKKLEINIK